MASIYALLSHFPTVHYTKGQRFIHEECYRLAALTLSLRTRQRHCSLLWGSVAFSFSLGTVAEIQSLRVGSVILSG